MTRSEPDISIVSSNLDSISGARRFSHEAMATIFEVIILHPDAHYAEQAAWAAFDELERLEAELSRFIENSDISRINNLTPKGSLRVGPAAFECLQLCTRIYAETNGAFDITIGYLYDCWLGEDKTMRKPSKEQLNLARKRTGIDLIKLDEAEHAVQVLTEQVQIDVGGVGKGYAVDRMAQLLGEWSIDTALIHSGHSSVLAIGGPPATKGWPVTLSSPGNRRESLACLYLRDRALGGSGLQKGRHIIDPHTAQPVEGRSAAWVFGPTAAIADALSTAFMVMAPEQVGQYCLSHSDILAMIVLEGCGEGAGTERVLRYGRWKDYGLLE